MRLRFTLRWAMLGVVLAAILIGPGYRYGRKLQERSHRYQVAVDMSELEIRRNARIAAKPSMDDATREHAKNLVAWYTERARLYERAVYRPWMEVKPMDEPPHPNPPTVGLMEFTPATVEANVARLSKGLTSEGLYTPPPKDPAEKAARDKRLRKLLSGKE